MLKRAFVAVLAAMASLAVVAGSTAAATTGTRFTFAGESATATLSNCGSNPAPGTECIVLFVFASEERVSENGVRVRDESLLVELLDVRITGPGQYEAISFRLGFTTDATVTINGALRSASASADEVQVPGLTFDIDVSWTGVGLLGRSGRTRSTFEENGTKVTFSIDSRIRDAVATAVLDGVTFTESDPLEIPSFLNRSSFGEVCRGDCPPSAL